MALRETFASACEVLPATISSGSALSGTLNLGGLRLFSIAVPSAWTSASLTFQVSPDAGATWFELLDQDGSAYTVGAAASGCSAVDPKTFAPFQHIRIRSGALAGEVAQTTTVSLQLFLRTV